jgi:BirA family biotin operon repressor/biotin-[acetyl-CoA-carboxylase] ligase
MTDAPRLPPFFRLLRFETIDSTSTLAKRLAAEGAPEGTLVWAGEQTAGRGRRGHSWVSVPGNLYLSLVLRPDCPVAAAAQLGFAAALAIAEAAARFLPAAAAVRLKWPNDVLLDGRKLSGILFESAAGPEGRLAWLVAGIGVNLASHPAGTETAATSLAAAGAGAVAPAAMLEALAPLLLDEYERWQAQGFAPLRRAWLARAHSPGAPLRVRLAQEELLGRFLDLDEDGALVLETAAGPRRVATGDVFPAGG